MRVIAIDAERSRPLRQTVLRPHQTLEQLAANERPDTHYVGIDRDGEIVAIGRVRPEGPPGSWRVSAMATAPDHRGCGLGRLILRALVEHASARGATRVWCNARLAARGFYDREGWVVESEVFDLPDIGPHVVMARALGPVD